MLPKYNTCVKDAQVDRRIDDRDHVASYRARKLAANKLSEVLQRIGDRRWADVRNCTGAFAVARCVSCGEVHTMANITCKHRLCPLCQTRRSRKLAAQALDAIGLLRSSGELDGATLMLLTLTQRNVPRGSLGEEIDKLLDALTHMRLTRDMRRYVIGSARNVEITYNKVCDTWHPHVHLILIMRREPEKMHRASYWSRMWARLMKLPYDPVCDIRPIKDDGAIYEVSKYVSKSMSILSSLETPRLDNVIGEMIGSLRKRQLVTYSGIWREARKKLNQVDPDEIPDDRDEDLCSCGGALFHSVMVWTGSDYVDTIDGDLDIATPAGYTH